MLIKTEVGDWEDSPLSSYHEGIGDSLTNSDECIPLTLDNCVSQTTSTWTKLHKHFGKWKDTWKTLAIGKSVAQTSFPEVCSEEPQATCTAVVTGGNMEHSAGTTSL